MKSDIEIAQEAKMEPIVNLADRRLGIGADYIDPYGHFKGKISLDYLNELSQNSQAKVILVTAISPTPAGEGKTTTTVGLGDALNRIGKKAIICLREPSLGPVFGMKGGAAGGGKAQVVPMEDINLHFTGDFNAIQLANNLLAALLDNHIHHGNVLDIDVRRISWKRVVDMNDRALREVVVSLGGPGNGYPRQDGFDIVVASEVMAVLCLAESMVDLKKRLGQIVIGYSKSRRAVTAEDLGAAGAMAALLKDSIKPNLVQTLENNPAIIHGGPFANIAHGCNSVIGTKAAMKLGDYVVTEAGFGADLGAEKFLNIKCRKAGISPAAVVIVATVRALKFHGGLEVKDLGVENLGALERGFVNLRRHVSNLRKGFGLPCVVSINHFSNDTDSEIKKLIELCDKLQVPVALSKHWEKGGEGAKDLAEKVVTLADQSSEAFKFTYDLDMPLIEKIESVARNIYGAKGVSFQAKAKKRIEELEDEGYGSFPVCIAKTQYSFSSDPKLRGAPDNHVISVREIRLSAGAEFVVVVCGDIMTMPGLPKVPAANTINLTDEGLVQGLF